MTKRFLCLIILIFLCSSPVAAKPYTVGIIPYLPASEFVVADYKGFYEAEGLDVESIYYSSTGDWVRALSAGKLDFSGLWNATQVDMYYRGSTARRLALMSYDSGDYKMVVKKGLTAKDLKGMPIAVFADYFGTHVFIQDYLKKAGLGIKDVKLIEMTNLEGYKNLKSGRVKAMVFDGKYIDRAIDEEIAEIANIDDGVYLAATTGGPSYFENGRKIPRSDLKKMVRAWVKSIIWIEDPTNRAEFKKILTQAFKANLALVGLEHANDFEKKKPHNMLVSVKNLREVNNKTPEMFEKLNRIWKSLGYQGQSRAYKEELMFDSSLIMEILTEMKL